MTRAERERESFLTAGMYRQTDTVSRIWYNYKGHFRTRAERERESFLTAGMYRQTDTVSRIWYNYKGHFRTRAERERAFSRLQGCTDKFPLLVGYGIVTTATS